MCRFDGPEASFEELTASVTQRLSDAVDGDGNIEAISEQQLGRLMAAAIRAVAAKAQNGQSVSVGGGNATITATDAVISCTAILESVGLAVFELAAWQAVSNIGSSRVLQTDKGTDT